MSVLTQEEKLTYLAVNPAARTDIEHQLLKQDGVAPGAIETYIDRIMVKDQGNSLTGFAVDKEEKGAFVKLKPFELP